MTVWSFLLALSFYPHYFGFLAWLSLVRPIMIIARLRGRQAISASYFFSFCFNAFSLYWIAIVTPPGTVAAVVIVSFYYTVILVAFNRLYHFRPLWGAVALPFLWVGLEYFRTLSQFAFPWSDLGYSQAYYLYILQIVSVVSVHGLSFLIVLVNVLIWQVFRREVSPERRVTAFLSSAAIVLLLLAYGWIVVPRIPVPGSFDIAVLQGSVPLKKKWAPGDEDHSYQLYDSLTQSVGDTAPNLYIWPETAAPCYLSHDARAQAILGKTARKSAAHHLIGALGVSYVAAEQRHFNSCYQVNPSGRVETRYDKVKLVPFSEHVPYQDHLPFLSKDFLTRYMTFIETYDVQWWSDFYPGDSLVLFELPDTRYAVLICFESTFPMYAREAILKGADFVVGITNDTWFGHSVGVHMHARVFLTRAVENRCWMARATNSGFSYIVDGYGRIRQQLQLDEVATLRGAINPLDGFSVFTRFGDVAGLTCFLITVSGLAILSVIWLVSKLSSLRRS